MSEQWYSIVEYAREFAVSDMTVRRRIKTGRLHAVLKDGKYYIPIEAEATQNRMPQPSQSPPTQYSPRSNHPRQDFNRQPTMQRPAPISHPEMTVVKRPSPQAARHAAVAEGLIPTSIRSNLQRESTSTVDTQALLNFCNATLKKLSDTENRLSDYFETKMNNFAATLAAKDSELQHLRQQVEDLQLLIKILEK